MSDNNDGSFNLQGDDDKSNPNLNGVSNQQLSSNKSPNDDSKKVSSDIQYAKSPGLSEDGYDEDEFDKSGNSALKDDKRTPDG
jgi:hypothetical protein